jgi:hypothetical protein
VKLGWELRLEFNLYMLISRDTWGYRAGLRAVVWQAASKPTGTNFCSSF